MHVIGLDIGGTNIKAALFDGPAGNCLARATLPTDDGRWVGANPAWAVAVRSLVDQFETQVDGPLPLPVGISAPGLAARDGRRIAWMRGRMEALEGFDWPQFLDRPVTVVNDAHAALVGEVWQGAARGASDVVMLTLGTGVGGAIMSGSRLLRGHLGRAGHLGHISLDPDGPADIVGTPGSLEDAVGNATVAIRSGGKFLHTRELLEAALTGDPLAREVWDRSLKTLAAGMISLMNALDPEVFILGGGIAAGAWEHLERGLRPWLASREWRPHGTGVQVVKAELGEWAGAYGAARVALDPTVLA